jgi:CRISPR-associated protein Cmr3
MSAKATVLLQDYVLRPQDALVFRSGKPFEPGIRDEAQYPSPAAWAGMLRTRAMDALRVPVEELRAIPAHGALLARHTDTGIVLHVPKPADALLLSGQEDFLRFSPTHTENGTGSDLPPGLKPVSLQARGNDIKGKPQASPAFWSIDDYLAWACAKPVQPRHDMVLPTTQSRTHLRIDRVRDAAEDGQLFRTDALDFGARRSDAGYSAEKWLFLGRGPHDLPPGLVVFGGERRLSYLEPIHDSPLAIPQPLRTAFEGARGLAMTMATPAIFKHGWKPDWLKDALQGVPPGSPGLRLQLVAAKIDGWQPISGWDLQRNAPKATRRAVTAGATYWFEVIDGDIDPQKLWLAPMSDDSQDQRDGFGLALVRPWQPLT